MPSPVSFAQRLRQTVLGAAVLGGLTLGVGSFTFWYANGSSYLTDDPAACANCHIMQDQFKGWSRGPHHHVAVCNDCHTPADFTGKWFTKALNGYHHSVAFTLDNFHEPIQITPRNRAIAQAACLKCHEDIVSNMNPGGSHPSGGSTDCIRCHSGVGH